MDKTNISQEEQIILRRMIWVNTSILIFILFLNANMIIWMWVDVFIYRAASFLVVSLVVLILWNKWRKLVMENLN